MAKYIQIRTWRHNFTEHINQTVWNCLCAFSVYECVWQQHHLFNLGVMLFELSRIFLCSLIFSFWTSCKDLLLQINFLDPGSSCLKTKYFLRSSSVLHNKLSDIPTLFFHMLNKEFWHECLILLVYYACRALHLQMTLQTLINPHHTFNR